MFGITNAMATALTLIRSETPQGNDPDGTPRFTGTLVFPNALKRQDGTPSQDGDVVSCQPNGTFQARPAGSAGSYELYAKTGGTLGFNPEAGVGWAFGWTAVPNNG